MKKILLGLLFLGSLSFAQNYPDYYPTNNNYDNGYYTDSDDEYYFPEDYYYQYPNDYYTNDYYSNSYNDYQRSINNINWNRFFVENRLSPWQIQQIMYLNEMYPSFTSWNNYYHYNPNRWYYDRYYALQQILGAQVFVVFQNVYYGGYSPVVYYRDYCMTHYRPNIYVMPRYRNVNINLYRVDRRQYHQNNGYYYNPRQGYGFKNSPRSGSNGNWNNSSNNNGFRNTEGFRGGNQNNQNPRIEGNANPRAGSSQNKEFRSPNSGNNNSSGFRKSNSNSSERGQNNQKNGQRSNQNTGRSANRLVNR